ncbi:MAG: hypothetical protein NDJ89_11070 [Oligoflexia bacterium]|nr:hypothetical protein [Oligoflexia bacterium]
MSGRARFAAAALGLWLALTPPALASEQRGVTLGWAPVKSAVRYEVELYRPPALDSPLERQVVEDTSVFLKVTPGVYAYRVRGIHAMEEYGPWSELAEVAVNTFPPKAIAPEDGAILSQLPEGRLEFRWSPGVKSSRYRIEIRRDGAAEPVFRESLSKCEVTWIAKEPGDYVWQVSFEGDSEWGRPHRFRILAQALPPQEPSQALADPFWTLAPGLLVSHALYAETGIGELRLASLLLKLDARRALGSGAWDFEGGIRGTALSLDRSLVTLPSARFYGLEGRAGWRSPLGVGDSWVKISAGLFLWGMKVEGDAYGLWYVGGPQLQLSGGHGAISPYLRLAPLLNGNDAPSLSSSELTMGISLELGKLQLGNLAPARLALELTRSRFIRPEPERSYFLRSASLGFSLDFQLP